MEPGFYSFQLGNFDCVSLYDGVADYKPESMVSNAPRIMLGVRSQALVGIGILLPGDRPPKEEGALLL